MFWCNYLNFDELDFFQLSSHDSKGTSFFNLRFDLFLEKCLQKLKIFCANMGWAECHYLKTQNNWKTCIFSVEFLKTPMWAHFSYWYFLHPGVSIHACKLVCLYELPKKNEFIKESQPHTPSFPIGLVKTECNFIVRSVKTDLGRWMLVVAMISVDAYPCLAFSGKTCHFLDTGIGVFW